MRGRLVSASVVAVWAAMLAPAAWAASLEDELRALITDNPRIKSNQAQVLAADKGVDATLAPFLPSADVTGGYGYEHVSLPAFRADKGPFKSEAQNYLATLRENVFDGGKKMASRRAAKLQRDVADLLLTNTRQALIFEGTTAYLNVLRHTELVDLSNQNSDNIRHQLNLEDERVRRGSGIAVDVLQSKSRLQISLERLVAEQGALEDAKSRYDEVHGHPPEPGAMALPLPIDRLLPESLDYAITVALAENPGLLAYNKRIDQGTEEKKAIQSEYYPSVDIVLQNKYEQNYTGVPGIRRDSTAKLQATWNFFSGFGTNARAAQAAYDTESRRSDYIETRRKVEEQTRVAWQALQTATARVALLDNAVNIASEVFDSRKKLREAGKETVINVLDAENETYSARINYTSALYDARLAAYQLLLAIGRLETSNLEQTLAAMAQPRTTVAGQDLKAPPAAVTPSATPSPAAQTTATAMLVPQPAAAEPVGYQIQLGALVTAEAAEAEWRRLQSLFKDLLGQLSHQVTQFDSGKGIVFRLRAGSFPTKEAANDACAPLLSQKQPCFVADR